MTQRRSWWLVAGGALVIFVDRAGADVLCEGSSLRTAGFYRSPLLAP